MKFRITAAVFSILLSVAGCSDNNSSDDMDDAANTSGDMNGTPDSTSDTSQPAPGSENGEPPVSSEPGGDTSAIAGLWDAAIEVEGGRDQRYVFIAANGLYTDYDYLQDAVANGDNCYIATGPITLTLEDSDTNTYSLADDRIFTAVAEADTLSIQFEDGEPQEWQALTGIAVESLTLCN